MYVTHSGLLVVFLSDACSEQDARWPEDKENIHPASLARSRRLSTSSMPVRPVMFPLSTFVLNMFQALQDIDTDDEDVPKAAASATPPGAPPPPVPTSVIPASSTTIPTRNIELVHPAPGRRFLSLRAQPQPVQEVFDPALDKLSTKIYTADAFPDRRTRADMKLAALQGALRDMHETHNDIECRVTSDPVYRGLLASLASTA